MKSTDLRDPLARTPGRVRAPAGVASVPAGVAAVAAVAALAAVLVATPVTSPSPAAQAQARDQTAGSEQAVKETVHDFHDALAAGDSARALELLHSEVRVFESGHAETYSEYRSGHLGADMEFSAATERELVSEEVRMSPGGDAALYLGEHTMTGTFRDREIDAHGTETMVLVDADGRWRILHIHWSSR